MKKVELTLPKDISIGLSEARFQVSDVDGKAGELQVSKGSVTRFPKNAKLGYQMNWERFSDMMETNGRKLKRR